MSTIILQLQGRHRPAWLGRVLRAQGLGGSMQELVMVACHALGSTWESEAAHWDQHCQGFMGNVISSLSPLEYLTGNANAN